MNVACIFWFGDAKEVEGLMIGFWKGKCGLVDTSMGLDGLGANWYWPFGSTSIWTLRNFTFGLVGEAVVFGTFDAEAVGLYTNPMDLRGFILIYSLHF